MTAYVLLLGVALFAIVGFCMLVMLDDRLTKILNALEDRDHEPSSGGDMDR